MDAYQTSRQGTREPDLHERNSKADKQPSDGDSAPSNNDTTSSYLSNVGANIQPTRFVWANSSGVGVDCAARIEFDGDSRELETIALIKLNADVFPTKG